MNTDQIKKIAILLFGFLIFSGTTPWLGIDGKVVEVQGKKVKIIFEGKYLPRIGDKVSIGFRLDNQFIPVEGDWKIVDINAEFAWASAEGAGAGKPGLDYEASVSTQNPQKRSNLVSTEKNADERYDLAFQLWEGRVVQQDRKRALQLIKQGAAEGHPLSMRALGWIYEKGEGGMPQNYSMAFKWYRKAADAGASNANNLLGTLYENGNGVKQSYSKAAEHYRVDAEKGETNAKYNLARLYESGKGVGRDDRRAADLYKEACNGGIGGGCTNLGFFYETGKGVNKDSRRAADLYKKACDAGGLVGCANLGYAYDTGMGINQDLYKAIEAYEKACNGGVARGCGNLGWMVYQGRGNKVDRTRGRELMEHACSMGYQWGCDKLKELGR